MINVVCTFRATRQTPSTSPCNLCLTTGLTVEDIANKPTSSTHTLATGRITHPGVEGEFHVGHLGTKV